MASHKVETSVIKIAKPPARRAHRQRRANVEADGFKDAEVIAEVDAEVDAEVEAEGTSTGKSAANKYSNGTAYSSAARTDVRSAGKEIT